MSLQKQVMDKMKEAMKAKDTVALQALRAVKSAFSIKFKWMKKRGKLGGQNKVPRLSDDRKYIEELLAMNC